MLGKIFENVKWRSLAWAVWQAVRPLFIKLIDDPKSKWDDAAVEAVDYLAENFIKPSEAAAVVK